MKYSAVASVLFAVAAVAQPHGHLHRRHHEQHKREMVTEIEWVTETQYVTKLVDSTTTVWVTPGQEAKPTTTSTTTTEQAKFIESKASTTTSTSTSTTTSTSVYVAPEPTTTSTTSTSVYVAPEPTTTSTSVYVAPEPTTTEVYVAPTTTTQVYVAPTTTEAAPAASTTAASTGGSSGGSGTTYTGKMTYYDLGLGSCGINNGGEDYSSNIVAVASNFMGELSNSNPYCGKTITISYGGKTTTAKITDKCPSCGSAGLDVSRKVFVELLGSLDAGRVDIEWWFN